MIGEVDCSSHKTHKEHYVPHPRTGRLVCMVCHPLPANADQTSKDLQRFIDSGGRVGS